MSAPESQWRALLDLALSALDHVFGAAADQTSAPHWTLGGGTAIALAIDHRVSYDVDLFVPGVALKLFTPARNPAAALISTDFQWPGHDLKFERPQGEIDFLSPPLQTEPGFTRMDHRGRRIAVEAPEEVIVKKIRFRSSRFTARDVFDLAAVATAREGLGEVLANEVADALPRVQEAVAFQAGRGIDALGRSVVATASGHRILPNVFAIAHEVLASAAAGSHLGRSPAPG